MLVEIQLVHDRIPCPMPWPSAPDGQTGSVVEFYGTVRNSENGRPISALQYEAYDSMAVKVMRRKLEELAARHPCQSVRVWHRLGAIPVGDAAIYVGVRSAHRVEGLALLTTFMDELKKDVPIWKVEAL